MTEHWSRALVTLDDLAAFRRFVEAMGIISGDALALPVRLTVKGAAYRAVKERFILGDIPLHPHSTARGLGDTVQQWWKGPLGAGAGLVRQTANLLAEVVLNDSTRRAAALIAGLYGTVLSDSDYTLVLKLNNSSEAAEPLPLARTGS